MHADTGASNAKMEEGPLWRSGLMDRHLAQADTRRDGDGRGSPLLFQRDRPTSRFIWKGSSSMFISKWLIYCSLKPIGLYGEEKKKSHITLIMTPVPDGAEGNHFTNETQDSHCVEAQSAASYANPHVSVLLWLNGFLMTPLHVMGFSLNYRTMVHALSEGCKATQHPSNLLYRT